MLLMSRAIDTDGTIVYRAGLGQGTDQEWTSIFQQLSGSQVTLQIFEIFINLYDIISHDVDDLI